MGRYTLQERIEIIESDPEFHRKIILSERPISTSVALLTSKLVASEDRKIQELLLKSFSILNVLLFGAVYGPAESFWTLPFENEAGATVTVNGLGYREIINDLLWQKLDSSVDSRSQRQNS